MKLLLTILFIGIFTVNAQSNFKIGAYTAGTIVKYNGKQFKAKVNIGKASVPPTRTNAQWLEVTTKAEVFTLEKAQVLLTNQQLLLNRQQEQVDSLKKELIEIKRPLQGIKVIEALYDATTNVMTLIYTKKQ